MIAWVAAPAGGYRRFSAVPACGEFCASCGRCLACEGDHECDGYLGVAMRHLWMIYDADGVEAFHDRHPEAVDIHPG